MKLPSYETKASVYRKYFKAVESDEERFQISLRSFGTIWNRYCPMITTMRPLYDLCDVCKTNSFRIQRSMKLATDTQELELTAHLKHLANAKGQRDYYRAWSENEGKVS